MVAWIIALIESINPEMLLCLKDSTVCWVKSGLHSRRKYFVIDMGNHLERLLLILRIMNISPFEHPSLVIFELVLYL
jgi:hypothetical protein